MTKLLREQYQRTFYNIKAGEIPFETFGLDEIDSDPPILEAFIAEARVAV